MENSEVTNTVINLIVKNMTLSKPPKISDDLRDDLCLDSLDITEILMALEKKYSIEFEGEKLPPINTINDLVIATIQTKKE